MPNNLKNTEATRFKAGSQQVEIARKGAYARLKKQRLKGDMRQIAMQMLNMQMTEKTKLKLNRRGSLDVDAIADSDLTNKTAVVATLMNGALNGDPKMMKLLLEFCGIQEEEAKQDVRINFSKAEKNEES